MWKWKQQKKIKKLSHDFVTVEKNINFEPYGFWGYKGMRISSKFFNFSAFSSYFEWTSAVKISIFLWFWCIHLKSHDFLSVCPRLSLKVNFKSENIFLRAVTAVWILKERTQSKTFSHTDTARSSDLYVPSHKKRRPHSHFTSRNNT